MSIRKMLLGALMIFGITLLSLMCLLPTNEYMKMTFSEKLNNGYTGHILINGDSIGGTAEDGEWCMLVQNAIKERTGVSVKVSNISKPGNSSFAGIVSWEMLDYTEKVLSDLVILCYGQNDADDDSFAVNYEALIRNTIKSNPNAEIIAILESSQRKYTNKIKTIIELCDYYKIPYVDTIKAFEESGYEYEKLSDDGIHPNSKGKEIYAAAILDVIQSKLLDKQHILDFKGERPKNIKALNDKADQYLNYVYLPIDQMSAWGKSVTVRIPKCKIIGFDRIYIEGEHSINFEVDGKEYDIGYDWNYGFEQRHIDKVLTGNFNEEDARITFEEADILRTLNGVVCFK